MMIQLQKLLASWPSASAVLRRGSPVESLQSSEKVRFTSRPTRAVMHHPALPRFPHEVHGSKPVGRLKGRTRTRLKGKMARFVRHGAATLQPALPGESACLPNSGARLWRLEEGNC